MKIYYLNWETNDEAMRMYMSFNHDDVFKPEFYREHDYCFLDQVISLEDVYCLLNQDNRMNKTSERSLSMGDVINFDGKFYYVESIGFSEIKAPETNKNSSRIQYELVTKLYSMFNSHKGFLPIMNNPREGLEVEFEGMRFKILPEYVAAIVEEATE